MQSTASLDNTKKLLYWGRMIGKLIIFFFVTFYQEIIEIILNNLSMKWKTEHQIWCLEAAPTIEADF